MVFTIYAVLLGLLVGSLLNVVIYRLPIIIEREWIRTCRESLSITGTDTSEEPKFTLSYPRSHCPHCLHKLSWRENIPVISWMLQSGRCASCNTKISLRYPAIEVATASLFGWAAWIFGPSVQAVSWSFLLSVLLAIAIIDFDTGTIPNSLSNAVLWSGMLLAAMNLTEITLQDSVVGVFVGYAIPTAIASLFKAVKGRDGLGQGDAVLYSGIGAWIGWQSLYTAMVVSCIFMLMAMVFRKGKSLDSEIAFGPMIVLGTYAVLFFARL